LLFDASKRPDCIVALRVNDRDAAWLLRTPELLMAAHVVHLEPTIGNQFSCRAIERQSHLSLDAAKDRAIGIAVLALAR
jgi:fumarylacetoacetate (FAA) hydrolase family protein